VAVGEPAGRIITRIIKYNNSVITNILELYSMNGFFSGFYHKSISVIAVLILAFMDSVELWLDIELMRFLN